MNNIEVVLHGTDSLIVRSNGYSDVWNMMRLLNSNQLVSLSDVLVSVGLRPNEYDDMLSLPANQYYIMSNNMSKSLPNPKRVICSGPVTTVIYKDGSKTHVRKTADDENDYEKAFLLSWLYKTYGKSVVEKKLKEFASEFVEPEEPAYMGAVAEALNHVLKMSIGKKK